MIKLHLARDAMNGILSISKTRWAIAAIVLVHLLMVPLAINAITIMLGVQKGLTFQNQVALGSIVTAQYILLAFYLGFGSARLYVRTGFFLLGCTYVVLSVVWTKWMLGVYPSTSTMIWLTVISTNLFAGVLPAFGSAVVVSALRPLVGRVEQHEDDFCGQFQVSDLLKLMMLIAAMLCCRQFFIPDKLGMSNQNPIILQLHPIVRAMGVMVPCAISSMLVTLSRSSWWIRTIFLMATIAGMRAYFVWTIQQHVVTFPQLFIIWLIVASTLILFRLMGYRLRRTGKVSPQENRSRCQAPTVTCSAWHLLVPLSI